MNITYLSIFPELFDSFRSTTLISRAVNNKHIKFETINPRHFCDDRHRTVDDEIYGWGHGLLMKAPPIIESIKHWIKKHGLDKATSNKPQAEGKGQHTINKLQAVSSKQQGIDNDGESWSLKLEAWSQKSFHIIIPHPSQTVFNQSHAHTWSEYSHLLFVCGRYEGIDERVRLWLQKYYPDHCIRVSLGQFVTLGGELPAMTMTESIVRLLPWVINTEQSRIDESYSIEHNLSNIEHPQYTRPEIVEGMQVPDILLSGHHKNIAQWKEENSKKLDY